MRGERGKGSRERDTNTEMRNEKEDRLRNMSRREQTGMQRASASHVLGLKACSTTVGLNIMFFIYPCSILTEGRGLNSIN